MTRSAWHGRTNSHGRAFTCSRCRHPLARKDVWWALARGVLVRICPDCWSRAQAVSLRATGRQCWERQ